MANRATYHDRDLVFAKELRTKGTAVLGDPLQSNNLGQREFADLLKKAKVKPSKFHGLRHTAATLALLDGVPVKIISERLSRSKTGITLDIYGHALPRTGKDAAARMGSILHR